MNPKFLLCLFFLEISFSILMIAKMLNLFCNMEDLSHVLILFMAEKLRSHEAKLIGRVRATCKSLFMFG